MPEDARSRSRLVVVAVVLALGGWALLRWLADDAPPPAPAGYALEADPAEAPSPDLPAAPLAEAAVAAGPRPLPARPALQGTDWQRRLGLGTWLLAVRERLEAGEATPAAVRRALRGVDRDMLWMEAVGHTWFRWRSEQVVPTDEELRVFVREATEPSLAAEAFECTVSPPGAEDPVRVWTPAGSTFPLERLREAEALLRRLDRLAATSPRPWGYDVLATPDGGRATFPGLRLPRGVLGFYHLLDDLAVIGTGHGERALQRLLNHELIHAWGAAATPKWRSRFVAEGLAEYLMWIRPSDETLRVPPALLRDNFAWVLRFVELLQEYGFDIRTVPMRRLVELSPFLFYSLGWFLYGVSQACLAYLPPGTLERALETRLEAVLVEAVVAIGWDELLAWMRAHVGNEGDPQKAWITADLHSFEVERCRRGGDLETQRALQAVFGREAGPGLLWRLVWEREGDPGLDSDERVAEVLQRIAARGDGPSDLVVELTSALEQPLDAERARAAPWLAAGEVPAARGDAFARDLRRWLEGPPRTAGARVAGARAQTTSVVRLDVAPGARLDLPELLKYLRALPDEPDAPLILVLGGADADHRGRLMEAVRAGAGPAAPPATPEAGGLVSQWALDALSEGPWLRRTVLVVDVGDGVGDARPLAEALAVRTAGEGLVAWWHVGRVPPR